MKAVQRHMCVMLLPLTLLVALTGCIEYAFNAGHYVVDTAEMQPWRVLAQEGDIEAQYRMGEYYCCGNRPRYDNVGALHWYCLAAKQGQRDALFKVGELYQTANEYEGNIIPQSDVMAFAYYVTASRHGHEGAKESAKKLHFDLQPEQIKEAGRLIEDWPGIACEVER